jgi:hypothetical protein
MLTSKLKVFCGALAVAAGWVALFLFNNVNWRAKPATPHHETASNSAVATPPSHAIQNANHDMTGSSQIAADGGRNGFAQPPPDADAFDEQFLDQLQSDIESSINDTLHQVLYQGMTLTTQPQGWINTLIQLSPDGRFAAFVSGRDSSSTIIVLDRQTKTEVVLPAPPPCNASKTRSVRHLAWGEDTGHTLYAVEDAFDGASPTFPFDPSPENQVALEPPSQVLYTWQPGEDRVTVLDTIDGQILSLATEEGHRLRLVNESKEKGWGFVDLREYRDGHFVSSQTIPISHNGKPIEYMRPQLLSKQNELWFMTLQDRPNPGQRRSRYQTWLAVIDLGDPGSEARLVGPDPHRFTWTPDGESLVVQTIDRQHATNQIRLHLVHRNAMDQPVGVASKTLQANDIGLGFAGLSPDGQTLYLQGLTKETASTRELTVPGNLQLYEYTLPN